MTHQAHPTVVREAVQLLAEHGFDGMAQAMQLLFNECMKIERQQALGVGPYQRGEERRGQANGFKPKTVETRLGRLELSVPQTRGVEFYPSSLERGTRSERAAVSKSSPPIARSPGSSPIRSVTIWITVFPMAI